MKWIDSIVEATLCAMAFIAIALGTSSAGQAQEIPAERRRDRLPDALPSRATQDRQADQSPSRFKGTLPTPVSPPSILQPEIRPIDLDTALRLAGVQNPEFNLARQRVLEAVAMRQFAAAQILPSINPARCHG